MTVAVATAAPGDALPPAARVRIASRPDGVGLDITGLGAALIRRVVIVADPLVPPRVFLELLGSNVDLDLAEVVVDDYGATGLSPSARLVVDP